MTLKELLLSTYNDLTDDDKIELWNNYCISNNHALNWQATPVSQTEELWPISVFSSVQECIQMYSSITDDTGMFTCDYAIMSKYGYWKPFDAKNDINVNLLINAILNGDIDLDDLPDSIKEIIDNWKHRTVNIYRNTGSGTQNNFKGDVVINLSLDDLMNKENKEEEK